MPEDVPPDAIVIRFRPTSPDAVLRSAEKEHRRRVDAARPEQTFYRLSVFVGVKMDTESDEDVCRRLIDVAGLSGLNMEGQRAYWRTTAVRLQEAGVRFHKDQDEDELPEHFSLDLGSAPTIADVEKLLQLFDGPERMRP